MDLILWNHLNITGEAGGSFRSRTNYKTALKGALNLNTQYLNLSGEGEQKEKGYESIGISRSAYAQEYLAGKTEMFWGNHGDGAVKASREVFAVSDTSRAVEREVSGHVNIKPVPSFLIQSHASGKTSAESYGDASPDTFTSYGGGFKKSWQYYAGGISGERRIQRSDSQKTIRVPLDVILQTQRFSFLQTMSSVRYQLNEADDSLSSTSWLLNNNLLVNYDRHRFLGTGIIEFPADNSPVFQTAADFSSALGELSLTGNLQQRFYKEKSFDSIMDTASVYTDSVNRDIAQHNARMELNSEYLLHLGLSSSIRYGTVRKTPYLQERNFSGDISKPIAGLVKPELQVNTLRYELWDKNRYSSVILNNRSTDNLKTSLSVNRIGMVATRLSWSGTRSEENQYSDTAGTPENKQKGTEHEWRTDNDILFSNILSCILQISYNMREQTLISGTAVPDPREGPTLLPDAMIFRNIDAKTFVTDLRTIWQIYNFAQATSGFGFRQVNDRIDTDGAFLQNGKTVTWSPIAELIFTFGTFSFGTAGRGDISSGRYTTKSYNVSPFIRWNREPHISFESRGVVERSFAPDYRTLEFFTDLRIGF